MAFKFQRDCLTGLCRKTFQKVQQVKVKTLLKKADPNAPFKLTGGDIYVHINLSWAVHCSRASLANHEQLIFNQSAKLPAFTI
jgi:hypothetical protein